MAVSLWLSLLMGTAFARVVQMPEGGRAVPVAGKGVICGSPPAGWSLEADRTALRPPAAGDSLALVPIDVTIAPNPESCGQAKDVVTVVATAPLPEIEAAGVVLLPDEGRVELRGQRLAGVQVLWEAEGKTGQEACLEPSPTGKVQQCVVPVRPRLPADAALRWLPARGRSGGDVITFDANGARLEPAQMVLRPSRTVLSAMFAASVAVDVSQGRARVPLIHPEAVASVDCGQATCELSDGALVIWGVPAAASSVTARLRLAARVVFSKGSATETVVSESLPVFRCQLAIASGPPVRDADETQLVVRMDQQDQRCGKDLRLRWTMGGESLEAVRTVRTKDALFVQLRAGRITGERITVMAARADLDNASIATVSAPTAPAPRPRTLIELPRIGKIEFIPTNRDAWLSVAGAGDHARFVPLPIEGAYTVRGMEGRRFLVRGDENAGGFVSLRFGYRGEGLPSEFAETDLAVVSERVQRAVREASVPAPLGESAEGSNPLVELLCADARGVAQRLAPGRPHRIPFESRGTCRVVIHRERLRPEDGLQEIIVEADVTRPDGSSRSEARVSERMVLNPGADSRVIALRGGTEQFDHVLVRVSHVFDESRYALSPLARNGVPSAQWSVTIEGGRFRLYATAEIPAGLYRVNAPSGQLTLNFGVLSRITTLDPRGKERLLGAELGLMGVGLIQSPGAIGQYPPTLAAVGGLGIRVPLGGGAAVSVHAWVAYEFRRDFLYAPDLSDQMRKQDAPHWMFIFGPSIAIGNVGTNL